MILLPTILEPILLLLINTKIDEKSNLKIIITKKELFTNNFVIIDLLSIFVTILVGVI